MFGSYSHISVVFSFFLRDPNWAQENFMERRSSFAFSFFYLVGNMLTILVDRAKNNRQFRGVVLYLVDGALDPPVCGWYFFSCGAWFRGGKELKVRTMCFRTAMRDLKISFHKKWIVSTWWGTIHFQRINLCITPQQQQQWSWALLHIKLTSS